MNSKKFVLYDPEIDKMVSEIKRLIFLSMNGVVSESIEQKGVFYKKNFGVSLYRLKQIAENFEKNSILASQLWNLQYRETMILAIFLQPIEELSLLKAVEWSNEIQTLELAEIASKNLLSKLDFSEQLAEKCVGKNKSFQKAIGFFIFAEIVEKISEEKLLLLVSNAFEKAIKSAEICRAIIVFLQKVIAKSETLKQNILEKIEKMKTSELYAERLICEELMTQILYS
ncbi:MAG: hypothetical protein J6U44_04320 [Paludibacteraceae bacterium]|nr:hypothetical protein [Paludibacteraceae bacterium]